MKTLFFKNCTDMFAAFLEEKDKMVSWQLDEQGKRKIEVVKMTSNEEAASLLVFSKLDSNNPVNFTSAQVYFFVPKKSIIFKTNVTTVTGSNFCTRYPLDVVMLEEKEVSTFDKQYDYKKKEPDYFVVKGSKAVAKQDSGPDIMRVKTVSQHDKDMFSDEIKDISLDEEDKLFASQRETQRARPKKDKFAYLRKNVEGADSSFYLLFDLSQGGMSFVIIDEGQFQKGDILAILGFDQKLFDEPMLGQIMSMRDVDGDATQKKIGVKFIG